MNFGDIEPRSTHYEDPRYRRTPDYELPITPLNIRLEADRSPSVTSTISDPTTVIRWQSPQLPRGTIEPSISLPLPPFQTPIPSSGSSATIRPHRHRPASQYDHVLNITPVPRSDEGQGRNNEEARHSQWERIMNEVDLESNPHDQTHTPVDDTPYIRFAIDQLTRDQDVKALQQRSVSTIKNYQSRRIVPDYGIQHTTPERELQYTTPEREREVLTLTRKYRSPPGEGGRLLFNPSKPLSYKEELLSSEEMSAEDYELPNAPTPPGNGLTIFIPVDPPQGSWRNSDLKFVPKILRPFSMIMLLFLCLMMMALLIFCAVFSSQHNGLWNGDEKVRGQSYFLFRLLPQMLAGLLFIYIQCVMNAITRIMPFTTMAMSHAQNRTNAMFMKIFPSALFWPRWVGIFSVDIASTFFWLSIFTIPLQSCLFSVIQIDGNQRFVTVQGVAWTLITVYVLILIAIVDSSWFFFQRTTGLMWDPRSLADVMALLPKTNALKAFPGTDIMKGKEEIRHQLGLRCDRLCYWRTQNQHQDIFYCIGDEGTSTRQYALEAHKILNKLTDFTFSQFADAEKDGQRYHRNVRFRYIPWYLRDIFIILWSVAGFVLLLALIVVSFLSSTAIRKGFRPLVSATTNAAGFSSATFLYSFVPSILGLILYLAFQPLDMALRVLKPWSELSRPDGAASEESLLLDYAAAYPIQCTLSAISAGHYRIATASLLSTTFIMLPILAGGLFYPLTTSSSAEVKMYPNMVAFGCIHALLILYLFGLLLLIPGRYEMHLPHGVTCLAEVISFLHNSHMIEDAAFSAVRTKFDLRTRLMATRARGGANRWAFGIYRGRNGKECLGIERIGRRPGVGLIVSRAR